MLNRLKEGFKTVKIYKSASFMVKFYALLRCFLLPLKELKQPLFASGYFISLGCGYGVFENWLVNEKNLRITGIDKDKRRISIAKKVSQDNGKIDFYQRDVNELGTAIFNNKLDGIILIDILHHLSPKLQISLLKSTSQILDYGGYIIIKDIGLKPRFEYYWNYFHDSWINNAEVHCRSKQDWKDLLSDLGYHVHIKEIRDFTPYPHILFIGEKKDERKE